MARNRETSSQAGEPITDFDMGETMLGSIMCEGVINSDLPQRARQELKNIGGNGGEAYVAERMKIVIPDIARVMVQDGCDFTATAKGVRRHVAMRLGDFVLLSEERQYELAQDMYDKVNDFQAAKPN